MMTGTVTWFGLIGSGLMLGAAGAWAGRWLLRPGRGVLHWLVATSVIASVVALFWHVTGVASFLPAWRYGPWMGVTEAAAQSAVLWLVTFTAAGLMLTWSPFVERLLKRDSSDALDALRHLSIINLPASAVTLGLAMVLIAHDQGVSVFSTVLAGVLGWVMIALISGNVAALAGLRIRRGWNLLARLGAMLSATCLLTAIVGVMGLLVMLLLGIKLQAARGGQREPSLGSMILAGLFWYLLGIALAVGGVAIIWILSESPGPSLRRLRHEQGRRLTWFGRTNPPGELSLADVDFGLPPEVSSGSHPESSTETSEGVSGPIETEHGTETASVLALPVTPDTTTRPQLIHPTRVEPPHRKRRGASASSTSTAKATTTTRPALRDDSDLSTAALSKVFPTCGHYAMLALAAAVFVFYASLIPMEYHPLAWDIAVKRFSHIKDYVLGIDRRADLIANLVVLVPVTYMAMAAVTPARARWLWRSVSTIGVLALGAVYVVAIEFTQEWFPPRTVSVNDIRAGLAGAVIGVAMWLVVGGYVTRALKVAVSRRGSATAVTQVLWLFLAGLVIYSLFPLDVTLSLKTLELKYHEGRMVFVPVLQGHDGFFTTLAVLVRDAILFIPVGLMLARQGRRAMLWLFVIALGLEMARLPIFSVHSGTVHVLGHLLGGWLGLWLTPKVTDGQGRLSLGQNLSEERRRKLGTIGAVVWSLLAAAALLYPYKFNAGQALFKAKMDGFINWPFQYYYYAGEWSALTKVVQCMGLFVGAGLLMRWAYNAGPRRLKQGLVVMLLIVGLVGLGVEVAQAASGQRTVHVMTLDRDLSMGMQEQAVDVTTNKVSKGMIFSIGQVADVTDLLAYLAGAWAGWLAAGLVLPVESKPRE